MAYDLSNQGRVTEAVKSQLVRFIRDRNLPVGEKLPSFDILRQQFHCGVTSVSRAVKSLGEEGILRIRDKVGVFVEKPGVDGHTVRNIGVMHMRAIDYPFNTIFQQALSLQLYDACCEEMPFLCQRRMESRGEGFADYAGLKRNLEQHHIDGLIATVTPAPDVMALCECQQIPVCMIPDSNVDSNTVHFDYPFMIDKTLEWMKTQGLRRPAMLCFQPTKDVISKPFQRGLQELFGIVHPAQNCTMMPHRVNETSSPDEKEALPAFQEAIAQMARMAPERRPDALYIPDDVVFSWLIPVLAEFPQWKPCIVLLSNHQMPILDLNRYPNYWDVDAMDLAKLAVDKMLDMLQNGKMHFDNIMYRPPFFAKGQRVF